MMHGSSCWIGLIIYIIRCTFVARNFGWNTKKYKKGPDPGLKYYKRWQPSHAENREKGLWVRFKYLLSPSVNLFFCASFNFSTSLISKSFQCFFPVNSCLSFSVTIYSLKSDCVPTKFICLVIQPSRQTASVDPNFLKTCFAIYMYMWE